MSSQSVYPIAGLTLRHWTINSRQFVGGSQRPAPSLPCSEPPDGSRFGRLASKLTQVKADLARRISCDHLGLRAPLPGCRFLVRPAYCGLMEQTAHVRGRMTVGTSGAHNL